MTRKLFLVIFALMVFFLPSSAVLKEKTLDNTLSILRTELTNYRSNLERQSGIEQEQQQEVISNIMNVLQRASQNSLMLYSQRDGYVFDLTYACHEATEQYKDFQQNSAPFRTYIGKYNNEIARFDSLIVNLSEMSTASMSDKAKTDRNVCLTLAINIRHTLSDNETQTKQYIEYYNITEKQLKSLNDYANKRYNEIQNSIFANASSNYLTILKNLNLEWHETENTISEKYLTKTKVQSQWNAGIIIFFFMAVLLYSLIALAINLLVLKYLVPKKYRTENFLAKRFCIFMTTTVITLAMMMGFIRVAFSDQNFLVMASGLLVEFTWLMSVVLISLLLRLNAKQIKSAFRIYLPVMVVCFIIIAFRIVLIPNDLVNLLLPPILLVCAVWQWLVMRHVKKNVPKSDITYSFISLAVLVISVVCSWFGYTLLAVQIIIWWTMQLTCILTITCIADYMRNYNNKHHVLDKPINKSWPFRFVYRVVLPSLGVLSFILALYWAADVFNLSDAVKHVFTYHYIDTKNFSASIFTVAQVAILFFLFRFINNFTKGMLRLHFLKSDATTAESRDVMARNVVQVIVWGAWLLIALAMFHVSNTWLVVVSGGLSTGIGFASKDILENIYYGISLMAGRVKIGDYIICDGTRGRVSSISYTSTLVEAIDGSVIAFQNSQLFTKNYKNMTKNHGYELDILEVGVAYGTDIAKVKKLLIDNISKLPFLDKKRKVNVVLKSFGDSSIVLKILVWVPVLTQYGNDGEVLECVYNTLNDNHVEIPFPQQDVHIIHAGQAEG